MHHFQYVPKKQWMPFRNEIEELLHDVQNDLREKFTFQYQLIGSASLQNKNKNQNPHIKSRHIFPKL